MGELYKCATCGGLTKEKGHLCAPQPVHGGKCDYCGEGEESARHVCRPMREKLEYVCDACGRLAASADLLCRPAKLPGC